jgi:hypothetical protein
VEKFMTSIEQSLTLLRQAVSRIDDVLVPWGFQFHLGEDGFSSPGGFANGFYGRGPTRIRLIYRAMLGLGCIQYEQETDDELGSLRQRTTYGMGHPGYMRRIGHGDDCCLIEDRISPVARDGGDAVDAFIHDLRAFAAPTLHEECLEFTKLIRTGYSRTSVLWINEVGKARPQS